MAEEKTLLEYLKSEKGFSDESIACVRGFFDKLKLPVPEAEEYYKTGEGGALVLLNQYGCVIRITPQRKEFFEHPRVIQPLVADSTHELRVHLNPGGTLPLTLDESNDDPDDVRTMKELKNELKYSNIVCTDFNGYNTMVLPHPFDNYHVVIDDGALIKYDHGIPDKKRNFEFNPQEIVYGEIKKEFRLAIDEMQINPQSESISSAWRKCSEMVKKGVLVSDWLENEYKTDNGTRCSTTFAANRYSKKL